MKKYTILKQNIKYLFYSIIQLIAIIILIYFSILVFKSNELSLPINNDLSIKIQEKRAIFLLSTSTTIVITIFTFYLYISENAFKTKIFNWFFPMISFTLIFYYIYLIAKEKSLKEYIKEIYSVKSEFKIIFWDKPENDKEKKRIIINTSFTMWQFIITLIGFSFMIFNKESGLNEPSGSTFLSTFSYFTEWSNIATFVFMLLVVLTGYRFFFKNNSFILSIISYISIVGIAFCSAFIPMIFLYHSPFSSDINIVRTIWFHIINPTSFVLYGAYVLKISKQNMIHNKSYVCYAAIFPSIYGLYVYSLPFLTNVTIYGFVTNLNSKIIPYYGNPNPDFYNGGFESIGFLIGIMLMFFFVIYISRFILFKNLKKWDKINK